MRLGRPAPRGGLRISRGPVIGLRSTDTPHQQDRVQRRGMAPERIGRHAPVDLPQFGKQPLENPHSAISSSRAETPGRG